MVFPTMSGVPFIGLMPPPPPHAVFWVDDGVPDRRRRIDDIYTAALRRKWGHAILNSEPTQECSGFRPE